MKITDNIYALKHNFKIPLRADLSIDRFAYSFIILGKKHVCLVDCGVHDSYNQIMEYAHGLGRSKEDISTLILTHAHPDHIGAAAAIKANTGCTVIAHKLEKPWIEDIALQYAQRPVPGFNTLLKQSVIVDRLIDEAECIVLDNQIEIKFINSPGHSKGSLSVLIHPDNVLICADALILPGGFPIYEDFTQTINSVKKLRNIKGLAVLLSSWSEPEFGDAIYQTMDQSLDYLSRVHNAVIQTARQSELTPLELCAKVVEKLKLPVGAINPLVAASLQVNIKAGNLII
ncbi:MAG: MBL fold metallo-hydrolase [Candidatus Omnitrophota bacterium]